MKRPRCTSLKTMVCHRMSSLSLLLLPLETALETSRHHRPEASDRSPRQWRTRGCHSLLPRGLSKISPKRCQSCIHVSTVMRQRLPVRMSCLLRTPSPHSVGQQVDPTLTFSSTKMLPRASTNMDSLGSTTPIWLPSQTTVTPRALKANWNCSTGKICRTERP